MWLLVNVVASFSLDVLAEGAVISATSILLPIYFFGFLLLVCGTDVLPPVVLGLAALCWCTPWLLELEQRMSDDICFPCHADELFFGRCWTLYDILICILVCRIQRNVLRRPCWLLWSVGTSTPLSGISGANLRR